MKNKVEQRKFDAAMQGLSVTLGSMLLPIMTQGAEFMNSVLVPALMGATQFVKDNQAAFDGLGNMMRWFWNNVLLPVLKFWISSNAETARGIGVILEATGRLTGNKDLENFGKGVQNAATATKAWADSLKGIPDPAPVVLDARTEAGKKHVAELDTKIKGLQGKIVTATAKGDGKAVDALKRKLLALQAQKFHATITAAVTMNKAKDEIHYNMSGHGNVKFSAAATGGWRNGIVRMNEYGDELVSLKRPMYFSTAAESARIARGQTPGGGSIGGGAASSVTIQLHIHAAPAQQPREVWNAVRDGLLSLKPTLGPKGLAFG